MTLKFKIFKTQNKINSTLFLYLGIVSLWDFETGKLEGILKADESEVI